MLAQLCSQFSGVVSLFSYKLFKFGGDKIGVNVAKELFMYFKREINRQLKKNNIKGRKPRNDFRIGCVIGLFKKMEELGGWRDMKEKSERTEKKYFSNLRFRRSRKVGVSRDYFEAGQEAAKNWNRSIP
jgi:hypothetical protein